MDPDLARWLVLGRRLIPKGILMKRLVAFRAYLAIQAVQFVDLAFNEPGSRAYALLQEGGAVARAGTLAMGVLGTLALLDLIISDIHPNPAGRWVMRHRGTLWMLMGIGYASEMAVAVWHGYAPRLAFLYFTSGAACVVTAFLDRHYRFQERMAEGCRTRPEDAGRTGCDHG